MRLKLIFSTNRYQCVLKYFIFIHYPFNTSSNKIFILLYIKTLFTSVLGTDQMSFYYFHAKSLELYIVFCVKEKEK